MLVRPIGRDESLKLRRVAIGFTLVEVVVAIALGALLMTGLLGVLRGVSYKLRYVERQASQDWKTACKQLINRDLLTASKISSADGWIWLDGSFSRFQAGADPAERIGFRCVPWIHGQSGLVRMSQHETELITVGPRRIVIERLDGDGVPQPLSPTPTALPDRLRMWLWESAGEEASFVCDMVTR